MTPPLTDRPPARIGISGTGFVARALYSVLTKQPDFEVTGILSRRPVALSAGALPAALLTNSRDALIERADIVFECSGDTPHAAEVLLAAGEAGRQLVTMNAEAQVTVGSALLPARLSPSPRPTATSPAPWPSSTPRSAPSASSPVAYVNLKGFHDPEPEPREHALLVREAGEHARAPSPPIPTAARCRSSRSWWPTASAPASPDRG